METAVGSHSARLSRPLRPAALVVLTATVTLLAAVGVLPRWPGLIHLVALAPLDVTNDLQLLMVHAPGWPSFIAGVVLSVGVRAVVLAFLLGDPSRPGLLRAARYYLLVLPFAFVAAALLYAAKAVLFYLLFWLGLFVLLLLFVLTAASPWIHRPGQRNITVLARHGFRAGTLGAYLALLSLLGALANVLGDAGAVALVPVSGALTFATAHVLGADPGWRVARRAVAVLPAAGLVALVAVAATGPAGPPDGRALDEPRDGSVLLMSGVDSSSGRGAMLEIDPTSLGWDCQGARYYSYAGPGDGQPRNEAQCDIDHGRPYRPEDTLRPRSEQVDFLEAQTEDMGTPGVAVGHSQGVWLLWDAASLHRLPGVEALVLVGAFPENPVSYPAADQREPGRVGRVLLEAIQVAPRPGGTTTFEPDSPLGREWLGHPDAIEETLDRPLPDGVVALSVPSVFDLPLMHRSERIEGAVDACPVPVIHPNLPYSEEFHARVEDFLDERARPPCQWWRRAVGPALRHFSAPPS
jgi:hypothetical protein